MGVHRVVMAEKGNTYIDYFSNSKTPTNVGLHLLNGDRLTFVEENKVDSKHPLAPYWQSLQWPEYGKFKNSLGIDLYYRLISLQILMREKPIQ